MRGRKVKEMKTSPVFAVKPVSTLQVMMNFGDALKIAVAGNKIRRLAWENDKESFGAVIDTKLIIHFGGKFHSWLVTEGDIIAEDWVIV